jgi:hypothetical protein
MEFEPRGLMLRHDISAEEMGIIAPVAVSPDEIVGGLASPRPAWSLLLPFRPIGGRKSG